MGVRFRKSIKAGPVRVTLSKSGIGYSVGGKGFRATKKAGGGVRTTTSVPGTGISYVKDYNKAQKKQAEKSRAVKNSGNEEKPAKLTKPVIAFYLCLLFGWTGAHRFYTRKYATGVLYLLTFGLLCVGWITDGGALCFLALCLLLLGWVVDIVVYGCAAIKSSKQTQ